jgi:hypothetical protein
MSSMPRCSSTVGVPEATAILCSFEVYVAEVRMKPSTSRCRITSLTVSSGSCSMFHRIMCRPTSLSRRPILSSSAAWNGLVTRVMNTPMVSVRPVFIARASAFGV